MCVAVCYRCTSCGAVRALGCDMSALCSPTSLQHVPHITPSPAATEALQDISNTARKYAKAMHAPLVFCSASHGINVLKLFKLVFEKVFSIEPDIERKSAIGEPLFEY